MEELGWPKVYLVSPKQFEAVEGDNLYKRDSNGSEYVGISATTAPIITLHHGLRGKALANTIYHETFHIIWPWKKHWWIELAAEKMAKGGGQGYYSKKYNKTLDDVPSRDRILELAKRQVKRFNKGEFKCQRKTEPGLLHVEHFNMEALLRQSPQLYRLLPTIQMY